MEQSICYSENIAQKYRECIFEAREQWESGEPTFLMIPFDYAKQLDVPIFLNETRILGQQKHTTFRFSE